MRSRRIALSDLQVGMFVTSLDQSWFKSPFLRHKFLVSSPDEIDRLHRSGIRSVTIDPTRGFDLDPPGDAPVPASAACPMTAPSTASGVGGAPTTTSLLDQELTVATKAKERLTQTVTRLFAHMQSSGAIEPAKASEAVREITIVTRTLTDSAVFMAMSQGRHSNPALGPHALVTCTLSLIVGQAVELDLVQMQDLATGALLHDIGLIGIPRSILSRLHNTSVLIPRRDLERYQSHPRSGAIRIEGTRRFPLSVRQIVAEHHALPDKTGFPGETDPKTTSLLSRIVMITDRYDDLLTGFGGATPLDPHDAIQRLYLEAQDGRVDARLTSLFIKRIGVFPIYSQVLLNTGERAVVIEINGAALHLPVVHVTHTPSGQSLPSPARIDLAQQEEDDPPRSVARVLKSSDTLPPSS